MRIGVLVRLGIAAALSAGTVALSAGVASARPVPPQDFTCGFTNFTTPCNQSAHFTSIHFRLTPNPKAVGCPAFVATDWASVVGTGHGVEHGIINKAGDGWVTQTFAGTVTITAYLNKHLTIRDPNVPTYTGPFSTWFGGSFNKSNRVLHATFHFTGTAADGSTLRFHGLFHVNTTASGIDPNAFSATRC